jgi:hypothetical protein
MLLLNNKTALNFRYDTKLVKSTELELKLSHTKNYLRRYVNRRDVSDGTGEPLTCL